MFFVRIFVRRAEVVGIVVARWVQVVRTVDVPSLNAVEEDI
jgi:hypothetical protein